MLIQALCLSKEKQSMHCPRAIKQNCFVGIDMRVYILQHVIDIKNIEIQYCMSELCVYKMCDDELMNWH